VYRMLLASFECYSFVFPACIFHNILYTRTRGPHARAMCDGPLVDHTWTTCTRHVRWTTRRSHMDHIRPLTQKLLSFTCRNLQMCFSAAAKESVNTPQTSATLSAGGGGASNRYGFTPCLILMHTHLCIVEIRPLTQKFLHV
jgi:hypothetical protein